MGVLASPTHYKGIEAVIRSGMDQRYFEYHRIVESFVLGQLKEEPVPSKDQAPMSVESELNTRMKSAFINVLREEMLP